MEFEDIVNWLREGNESKAAELLSNCEFTYEYVDTGFAISGDSEITICDLRIHAPRRILDNIAKEFSDQTSLIAEAIRACSQSEHLYIQNIYWVPKLNRSSSSPTDHDIEMTFELLDSGYIKSVWSKALLRRRTDPDGAITTAKTLIEAVCKYILTASDTKFSPDSDIIQLYTLVSKRLHLSTDQYMEKSIKSLLGNCQAVIGGLALLRNKLGDAHATNQKSFIPSEDEAELAVNLSGTIATYLIKRWNKQNSKEPRVA